MGWELVAWNCVCVRTLMTLLVVVGRWMRVRRRMRRGDKDTVSMLVEREKSKMRVTKREHNPS